MSLAQCSPVILILRRAMDEAINKKRPLTQQEIDEIVRDFN